MKGLWFFVEHAALICLAFAFASVAFCFLVEWWVSSPTQGAPARVIELVREGVPQQEDRAA